MRDIVQSYTQQYLKSRRSLVIAGLLICCLLLLSACDTSSSPKATGQIYRHGATLKAAVTPLQREQGQMQLAAFQQWIALMQQFQGKIGTYQQQFAHDQQALSTAQTPQAYQAALQVVRQHVESIKIPALKNEASDLERELARRSSSWGEHHTYHDSYNGITYRLGYEYGPNGIDGIVQDELSSAKTLADYQQAIEDANTALINFQAYQTNTSDKTPWDKAHATDLQLLRHYQLTGQKVVVVSLSEQTLRVYNHGKLVRAIKVTTGRPEKPSLPGSWWVESKQSPTIFKSDEPKGSPYWYPDTPISYAMLYHSGGYFIHDSWWRSDYGPDTQFPHVDSSGDSFSFDGSHGCINVSTANAAWLYQYVSLYTHVIVY